jgi:hypothetical protein
LASIGNVTQPAVNGTFIPVRLVYDSFSFVGQGQPLEIRLISTGWQASFDNVRLSAVPFQSVPIVNSSFEATPLADLAWSTGAIPGWTKSGPEADLISVANMSTGQYAIQQATDGLNVAIVPNATIAQVLLATLQGGMQYRLSVDVGNRLHQGFMGYSVSLFADGTLLASMNPSQRGINVP